MGIELFKDFTFCGSNVRATARRMNWKSGETEYRLLFTDTLDEAWYSEIYLYNHGL